MRVAHRIAVVCAVLGVSAPGQEAVMLGGHVPLHVSAYQVRDLDGSGSAEIVEVDADARVRVGRFTAGAFTWSESIVLPDPSHSLLACADVTGDGREELIVASRSGVSAYVLGADGAFGPEPLSLSRRARIAVRAGQPTFAPFVQDINVDGGPDLILPKGEGAEMWMWQGTSNGRPSYRLVRTVALSIGGGRSSAASRLSDVLRNELIFPRLDMEDLNGDGRLDLLERDGPRRAFYLQEEDGQFAEEPITVDLEIFRDTTPQASIQPGETLVATDDQHMQSGDLNGDEIPDYVIAHRRRVWVFLASEAGPQFTKPKRRRVAEDISGLLLADLDDDGRQDLLVAKVQVPSAASLVLGLVSSMSIGITALGYATGEAGDFAEEPTWRSNLTIQIPALLSLMSEAEEIMERFEEILNKLRISTTGRFLPGDGAEEDLVMVSEDGELLEIWREGGSATGFFSDRGSYIRKILFDDPDPVFDIDRILTIVSSIFDQRTATLTGDRPSDGSYPLPDFDPYELIELLARDMDGDGVDEVILVLRHPEIPERLSFRVLAWR